MPGHRGDEGRNGYSLHWTEQEVMVFDQSRSMFKGIEVSSPQGE
jgi:hypothetical protein